MKLMPENNGKKWHYVTLYAENPNLWSGRKWCHRMYPVSVYQL